jgi:putative hydrolase of the HAD superfamily
VAGVSVVLFDLDDTLFAHSVAARAGFARHLENLGGDFGRADGTSEFTRWRALEEEHYPRYLRGELDLRGQRRARTRAFVAEYGLELADADADVWFDSYFARYEETWTLHDDVEDCLDRLSPHRFGVITNGDLTVQSRKIAATGLASRIDHVVASGELGVAKPDPRIFEHACRLFGIPPAEACYVGDRLHTDAIGATRAGLLGIWIDRDPRAEPAEPAEAAANGVPVIHSLDELPTLLASAG